MTPSVSPAPSLLLDIDDSPANRYWRGKVLNEAGFDVLSAATMSQAIALLAEHRPDLVLLDVVLPDGNGLDLCRRIKAGRESVPLVLLVSACAVDTEARVAGLEAGADGYLVMPGEPAELVAQVRALLRLQAAERAARQARDSLAAEIRQREHVEEALRRSEDRFRTMADGLPVMIWADDADGNCVFVNAAYEAFFGVTEAEVTTGGWQPFVHPDDSAHYVAEFLACTRERRPFHAEARVRRCDGEWRWIESRGAPRFSEAGEFLGFVGSSPDVTDRKQADAERETMLADNNRLIREAQDANRSKDRLLATVSHELRQPLSAMVTALHVMAAGAGPAVGQRARDILERQVHQLSSLVDDLLEASRLQNDKITLRSALTDLREVVQQAVEVVGPAVQQRRQVLAVDLPPSALIVEADRVRLQQVLTNLLLNASKFTPEGGSIQLAAQAIPHLIEITVTDTGVGLQAEEIAHIFDLFTQNSRGGGEGLGIGLAVARKLVELHGGTISAQSAGPGHGSTFRVLLPGSRSAGHNLTTSAPAERSH